MNRLAAVIALSLFAVIPALAQEIPKESPAGKKAISRPAKIEVITAYVMRIDAGHRIFTLKLEGKEQELLALVDDQSEFSKDSKPARFSDFSLGDKVVAQLSRKPGNTYGTLKLLSDEKTALAQKILRTQEAEGTVVLTSATSITIKLNTGVLQSYQVTEKTQLFKADRPVKPIDFREGDAIAIKPRGLASGTIQAVIVADKKATLSAAHTDGLINWNGVIEFFSEAEGLRIKRDDGAIRTVALAPNAIIARGDTTLTRRVLKPGVKVRLHLVKRESEDNSPRAVDKVMIVTR